MSSKKRQSLKAKLFKRDGFFIRYASGQRRRFSWCHWCDRLLNDKRLTIEHINPIYGGGKTVMENLALACRPCNESRNPHYKAKIPPPNCPTALTYWNKRYGSGFSQRVSVTA